MEAEEDIHLVKGGKKDPFVRRQELLVKSGLAEVCWSTCYWGIFPYLNLFTSVILFQTSIA